MGLDGDKWRKPKRVQPPNWLSLIAQSVKNLPAMQETVVLSVGQEDAPGEGNDNPLQYSFLENSMDRGA